MQFFVDMSWTSKKNKSLFHQGLDAHEYIMANSENITELLPSFFSLLSGYHRIPDGISWGDPPSDDMIQNIVDEGT